jgi:hypothetical protein
MYFRESDTEWTPTKTAEALNISVDEALELIRSARLPKIEDINGELYAK